MEADEIQMILKMLTSKDDATVQYRRQLQARLAELRPPLARTSRAANVMPWTFSLIAKLGNLLSATMGIVGLLVFVSFLLYPINAPNTDMVNWGRMHDRECGLFTGGLLLVLSAINKSSRSKTRDPHP